MDSAKVTVRRLKNRKGVPGIFYKVISTSGKPSAIYPWRKQSPRYVHKGDKVTEGTLQALRDNSVEVEIVDN